LIEWKNKFIKNPTENISPFNASLITNFMGEFFGIKSN